MLRFLSAIRHESHRYNHAFTEKAQHLRRWISLRILTRGRLVPRQPQAIKRTTPTALHHESSHNEIYIHWNIGIIPTVLHRYHIRYGKYIHWNTSIIPTALHGRNIHYNKYIHHQTITTQMALVTNVIYLVWWLIGNNEPVDIKQENNMTQTTGWFDAFQAMKWRRLHDKMRHIAAWTNHYPAMELHKIDDEWFDSVLLA